MRHGLMAAVGLAAMLGARPALAHAFLKTAVPGVGSTVRPAPAQVLIVFTEGVEPAFSGIAVTDAGGMRVDRGAAHAAGDETRLAIEVAPLPPGTYRVAWHATATDTHKTEGGYSFTITP